MSSKNGTVAKQETCGGCYHVIPYILPDLVKIALALTLTNILRRYVK